jgi:hypothetical protein
MEKIAIDTSLDRKIAETPKDIPGWGVDANPGNNPTHPMKNYNGADFERLNYERPPQQEVNIEVLHSIERPSVTSVFGTSTPPHGLSGAIRRFAFKYSESTYAHWVPLVVADRIDVVQGIIDDLKHGHVPNIFAEKGWKAEWKHNPKALITKIAVTVVVAGMLVAMLGPKKKSRGKG